MSRISAAIAALRGRQHPQAVMPGMLPDMASSMLRDAPHAMIVIQIDNGYLLRTETTDYNRLTGSAHLVYAPDAVGVAAAIVAHQARAKLGVEQYELPVSTAASAQQAPEVYTGRGP